MIEALADIFARHSAEGSDPGHGDKFTVHSYIPVYEELLAPFREQCDFMEIGIAQGLSMRAWGEYFGEECSLMGVDLSICFDPSLFDKRFTFISADATKRHLLTAIGNTTFDVIVEDGSHMEADQAATFDMLRQRMRKGGIYVIEDVISPDAIPRLAALHKPSKVFDLRANKGRFDDVLIVFQF